MDDRSHRSGPRSPEYALLGFLYGQPNHGYTLHQQLVTELGFLWHVSQSQTYAILKRLELQGYISSSAWEQEKLPTRQILQITDAGRRRFEEWLHSPSGSSVHTIRLEFITRLYFARNLFPDTLKTILDAQSAQISSALDRLEKSRSAIPAEQAFNHISVDLRIRQLKTLQEWVRDCPRELQLMLRTKMQ